MESPKKTRPKTCTGKFRLFRCFKPEFPDDVVLPPPRAKSVDPPLAYIVVPEKQHVVLPRAFSSAFAAAKGGEENESGRKKIDKDNNNSLRRALMAALNHTSLAKKMNSKRKRNKEYCFSRESTINLTNTTSSSSSSSLAFTPSSLSSSSTTTTSTTLSTTSMGTNASSGSSSEPYLSRSLAMNAKNKQNIGDTRKGYFGPNMGVSLLLITSLVVLIMWGKCCAIAYTSIGFFVVSNRRRKPCKEGAICCDEETKFNET